MVNTMGISADTIKRMRKQCATLKKNKDKRYMIVALYAQHGMDPQSIHEAVDYSLAFIHDTLRDFARECMVQAVKETANVQV